MPVIGSVSVMLILLDFVPAVGLLAYTDCCLITLYPQRLKARVRTNLVIKTSNSVIVFGQKAS